MNTIEINFFLLYIWLYLCTHNSDAYIIVLICFVIYFFFIKTPILILQLFYIIYKYNKLIHV